jgi:hypothetical protein
MKRIARQRPEANQKTLPANAQSASAFMLRLGRRQVIPGGTGAQRGSRAYIQLEITMA